MMGLQEHILILSQDLYCFIWSISLIFIYIYILMLFLPTDIFCFHLGSFPSAHRMTFIVFVCLDSL